MKNLLLSAVFLTAIGFISCGPSAEEIENKRLDSIAKADSIAQIEADLKAAKEKAIADSIAHAEELVKKQAEAKNKKGGKKDKKKK
ncbi:MAG: hypothetical protein A2275_13405 [Bacteroidetes bacterium RIFOXYA12_FULL_35_11]|nr:MAG: hypothetical protein A2X01_20350 [Bacteroidetes bacterium GWF2_35_48]OFY81664.1 MAG: hypothetical protein A2275_13405 [Bacteroidetes bacterium RIFOXYA12_FULL_35_11]OFY97832.1 MAG: hypothetical protein A2491_08250 [Bacteroidetes bacterium RIFOXYC12_FULL_35_7]HBX50238.1 hypothetical protein [Bacteroidales bacterium]